MRDPLTKLTGHLVEAMTWTDKKPTVPGWYWWRFNPIRRAHVMEISRQHVANDDVFTVGTAVLFLDEVPGEWSGPIPLPTDAPAQAYYKAEEVEAWLQGELDKVQQRSPGAPIREVWKESALDILDGLLDQLRGGA